MSKILIEILALIILITIAVIGIIFIIANKKSGKDSDELRAYKKRVSEQLNNVYPDVSKLKKSVKHEKIPILEFDPITHEEHIKGYKTISKSTGSYIVDDEKDLLYGQKITSLSDYQYKYKLRFLSLHPELIVTD